MSLRVVSALLATAAGHAADDSCVGHCGSWAQDCWCNDGCEAHHDCCHDYEAVCGGSSSAADLIKLDDSTARCLDGSAGAYYWREGKDPSLVLVFMEGGGWCYDPANYPTQEGTISDCRSRSQTSLGSSRSWASKRSFDEGMLASDVSTNPVFHNYSLLYMPYCDGTSFAGNVSGTVSGLFFRGLQILEATFVHAMQHTSFARASRVVLSGGSAGGTAVLWHADRIARLLTTTRQLGDVERGKRGRGGSSVEVLALPDAGFFLDLPTWQGVDVWPAQMRSMASVSNSYSSLHAGCLAKYAAEPERCLFPQYYAELIETRTMLVQSLYDSSELWYTLMLDCCAGSCSGYPTCKTGGTERSQMFALRQQHIDAWRPLVNRSGKPSEWEKSSVRASLHVGNQTVDRMQQHRASDCV